MFAGSEDATIRANAETFTGLNPHRIEIRDLSQAMRCTVDKRDRYRLA
jgi:hypothetical protein